MPPKTQHDVTDALISHASRDGLGEKIDWADVELAITQMLEDPVGASNLRKRMARLNEMEVARTLEDWFLRAADARTADANRAARPSDKILAPLQVVSMGGLVTAAVFALAGTLALPAAAIIGASSAVSAAASSYGRWRLSVREDEARSDAAQIRRFAEIAGKTYADKPK